MVKKDSMLWLLRGVIDYRLRGPARAAHRDFMAGFWAYS
jgi:hypothetical protein